MRYIFLAILLITLILNAEVSNSGIRKNPGGGKVESSLQQTDPIKMDELPLISIPASVESSAPVFIFISGDGGWTSFDNTFCELLAKKGMPVVALDAKKYFWNSKSPEETTSALVSIIGNYSRQWNRNTFILAGYSFGADIVPFIVNRLPESLKGRLSKVILLSPDRYGDFEIHLTDMLSLGIAKKKYNIVNEVKKITTHQVVSICGEDEDPINPQSFKEAGSKIIFLPGDHHYNKNVTGLAEMILKVASDTQSKAPSK